MENRLKSKLLLSIFVDFILLSLLLSLVFFAFFITKTILYPEEKGAGELTVQTERMPKEYLFELSVGDSVFDTLTKRRVGEITAAESYEENGEIYFILTLEADFKPRSGALRTDKLWFYFKEAE